MEKPEHNNDGRWLVIDRGSGVGFDSMFRIMLDNYFDGLLWNQALRLAVLIALDFTDHE